MKHCQDEYEYEYETGAARQAQKNGDQLRQVQVTEAEMPSVDGGRELQLLSKPWHTMRHDSSPEDPSLWQHRGPWDEIGITGGSGQR